jgi:predicted enzyme involved in methoxymalonyl-ACP biosynthesis
MYTFSELKKLAKQDLSAKDIIRIAVVGNVSTQHVSIALKGYAPIIGMNIQLFETDYNQIDYQVFNDESELHKFKPEYVLLIMATEKEYDAFIKTNAGQRIHYAQTRLKYIYDIANVFENTGYSSQVIFTNFIEISDNIYGNYQNKVESTFVYQIRKLNFKLMELASRTDNFHINDLLSLQSTYGYQKIFNSKMYVLADMVFDNDNVT